MTLIFLCEIVNITPTHFARNCAHTTRHIKWGWNIVGKKNIKIL